MNHNTGGLEGIADKIYTLKEIFGKIKAVTILTWNLKIEGDL
jgi:hypothetical protein